MKSGLVVALFFCVQAIGIYSQNLGAPGRATGKGTVVLKAARLIDGTGAAPITNAVVVVRDNKILAVGKSGNVTIPAGSKIVDLGNATLLPGVEIGERLFPAFGLAVQHAALLVRWG